MYVSTVMQYTLQFDSIMSFNSLLEEFIIQFEGNGLQNLTGSGECKTGHYRDYLDSGI